MSQQINGHDGKGVNDFFTRCRLPVNTRVLCWEFVRTQYPESTNVQESQNQGFCSYTLNVGRDTIVQFRRPVHKLNIDIIALARLTYGELVPLTELIGAIGVREDGKQTVETVKKSLYSTPSLLIYSQSRVLGLSLADLNRFSPIANDNTNGASYHHLSLPQRRDSLVRSFASFIALGLSPSSFDTPVPRGRIGKSIRWRLETMHRDLPPRFRPAVQTVLDALPRIEALPWVLTHGDLVPSNILVASQALCRRDEPGTATSNSTDGNYTICGLIDWAEAEYLPFGVGIYGLEEFLGVQAPVTTAAAAPPTTTASSITNNNKENTNQYPPPGSTFTYVSEADTLRRLFWDELQKNLSSRLPPPPPSAGGGAIQQQQGFLETVKLAQLLGILLWHGIAFDDGRLDRVVCEGRDDEEVQRLDVMISGTLG